MDSPFPNILSSPVDSSEQSVKSEALLSPDLPQAASASQYQLSFHSVFPPSPYSARIVRQDAGSGLQVHNLSSAVSHSNRFQASSLSAASSSLYSNVALQHAIPFSDDQDDVVDVTDNLGGPGRASEPVAERTVRRRTSKACDQCRKSKCKCERLAPNQPCRNCKMLGMPCTFLGPSRKRGPPKGYIDTIEARLHQAEAVIGIMLGSGDSRAETLLNDISEDPLAREIINRIDNSPYGVKGRKSGFRSPESKTRYSDAFADKINPELASIDPSNEWQDRATARLRAEAPSTTLDRSSGCDKLRAPSCPAAPFRASSSGHMERSFSSGRRQRRKMNGTQGDDYFGSMPASAPATSTPSLKLDISFSGSSQASSPTSTGQSIFHYGLRPSSVSNSRGELKMGGPFDAYGSRSDDEEFTGAMGQLSLNEDDQVRFHGTVSGLHILGVEERVDHRNEGGIWRLPEVRVWPPLSSQISPAQEEKEEELSAQLPSLETQKHLLSLYFKHVQPFLPIIHERTFYCAFQSESSVRQHFGRQSTLDSDQTSASSSYYKFRPRRIPVLLLFTMFAIAVRYSTDPSNAPRPSSPETSWTAGDIYLEYAQAITARSYTRSRPSTCQALLLMGYREMGIGALGSAWTHIGMAIRMAQDLGMHRRADSWAREGLGGKIFGNAELQERRRIWYACVIMDKYISAYIGRPLMIFERDFDTSMPDEDPEDGEEKNISCFNASGALSGILSMIIQAIYAVRPVSSRHEEAVFLEGVLDKWYYGLPDHLQYDLQSSDQQNLAPNVLTLHMQYWCTVLLLHRPFIRRESTKTPIPQEEFSEKSYELCTSAANHITSIAMLYLEQLTFNHCPVFLCYYVFSASIMHIVSISLFPDDPQAPLGLSQCVSILSALQVTWPGAGRVLELLKGSKVYLCTTGASPPPPVQERQKRPRETSAAQSLPHLQIDTYQSLTGSSFSHDSALIDDHQLLYSYHNHRSYTQPTMQLDSAAPSPYMTPAAYQRWSENHFDPSSDGMLTSALPQTYNTGLTDVQYPGQCPSLSQHVSYTGLQSSSSSTSESHRLAPRYRNDYSMHSPLDNENYSNPPDGMNPTPMFLHKSQLPYNHRIHSK